MEESEVKKTGRQAYLMLYAQTTVMVNRAKQTSSRDKRRFAAHVTCCLKGIGGK